MIITEIEDKNGDNVLVALHLDRYQKRLRINRIASVYGKHNITGYIKNQIKEGNMVFPDNDTQKKSIDWATNRGLQLPKLVQSNIATPNVNISEADKKSNKKFSLSVDSEGRLLTKEQQEYFKDSKVIDSKGALKVIHHVTNSYGFDVFDIIKALWAAFAIGVLRDI